jgi:hypothetical protein
VTLSCDCDFDPYDCAWYWYEMDLMDMEAFARRKRCKCCGELINPGEEVFRFLRYRVPRSDIEESIYGDEVPLAPGYTCEICSGLITAVRDLGFCWDFGESLKSQIADYREMEKEARQEKLQSLDGSNWVEPN